MSPYDFAVIDPRPGARDATLALVTDRATLGIEMTVPNVAAACSLGTLDPQHTDGDIAHATIEAAMECDPPPPGALLVTVRPDLDAFGAMALLSLRAQGVEPDGDIHTRVQAIAESDKRAPGVRATEEAVSDQQALAALVADHRVDTPARIASLEQWLASGTLPPEAEDYRQRVAEARPTRAELVEARTAVRAVADGRVALLESGLRSATSIAYERAPVAVVWNPSFTLAGDDPHLKYTVCQREPGHIDLVGLWGTLNALEHNGSWGGSPTVGGSPQGTSTSLSRDHILAAVIDHLVE